MNKQVGIMINEIAFPNLPILLKNAGYDFMILDCEHGAFDFTQVASYAAICKLYGMRMIVRIGQCLRKDITRYMDMGADGILLSMTSFPEQIREVVTYAKYAPIGKRGISTMRAHTLYNPPSLQEYMLQANERTYVFAQIETADGVKNAREIAQVTGVDGVLFGPNDYSCDVSAIGDRQVVCGAIEEISRKVKDTGKPFGIITGVKEYLQTAAKCGMTIFSVTSELNLLSQAAKQNVREMREML